ncbi:MAG: hypothetical protein UR60_C0017G0017 [Candidatus Moranbacteria bacterium GW2011_GWF2_34_56]|nr:MAG: hypothetical protein UR51_C0015G0020 [Candidatus Moranbacteria bacterium GW2011_GWF1_34_10]KKP64679.1 MAG: hypothetical protein UR60_C0017G0017 [Candidatus Moranbacteria bacterium GW2011_GWF2_34_56]HBI17611.1 hypothetical protein [Candidatus Moranbacteria bacterium]
MKKKIDYVAIVKEAINITKRHRTLWWFGFLAIFSGSYSSFNYSFPSNNSENGEISEMEMMSMLRKVSFYWELYKEWIILGIILIVILLIALYIIGLIGRGALINSIFKSIKKEAFSFSSGLKTGVYFLGRLFLIKLFFSVAFLILAFVLIFPIVRLAVLESYTIAISLGIVAFLLLVSSAILFFYFRRYGEMYLIGSDLSISNSIKLAYRLFEKNIKESLLMGLVLIALNIVVGVVMVFVLLGLLIPLGIAGAIIYKLAGELTIIILAVIAILIFIGFLFLFSSILNVFFEAVWILFFHEIAKGDKNDLLEKEKSVELSAEAEPGMPV